MLCYIITWPVPLDLAEEVVLGLGRPVAVYAIYCIPYTI